MGEKLIRSDLEEPLIHTVVRALAMIAIGFLALVICPFFLILTLVTLYNAASEVIPTLFGLSYAISYLLIVAVVRVRPWLATSSNSRGITWCELGVHTIFTLALLGFATASIFRA